MKTQTLGLALLSLLMASPTHAEFYTDAKALKQLLSGNSLAGRYNELEFIQTLSKDGTLKVVAKGDKTILKATWFINEQAEYCEQWPDHVSCFQIGLDKQQAQQDGKQLLQVKSDDPAEIVSYLYQGIIPLEFPVKH